MNLSGKHFWWSCAGATLLTIGLLVGIDEKVSRTELIDARRQADRQLAQTLGNVLNQQFASFFEHAPRVSKPVLDSSPQQRAMEDTVRATVRGLPVLRVQIIDPVSRKILYSTLPGMAAELAPQTPALLAAGSDEPQVSIARIAEFSGLQGGVLNRDIAHSAFLIHPAGYPGATQRDALIVELHSDVSEMMARYRFGRMVFALGVILVTAVIGSVIFLVSRRHAHRMAEDAKARLAHEQRIHDLAYLDRLTGLPNHAWFVERLEKAAQGDMPGGLGVLSLDLDRFKSINDMIGHEAANHVLQELARRMRAVLGMGDQLYRVGGDDFVVLHRGVGERELQALAQDLITVIQPPVDLDGSHVYVSGSVGIARWPEDHPSLELAVRCADMALAVAKGSRTRPIAQFLPQMRQEVEARAHLMAHLQLALARGEFVLHYQPRVNSVTAEIESVEALIRWQHPEKGLLYPDKFIAALEDSPLIVEVGRWVMLEACRQVMAWREMGLSRPTVSVNVAPRQFRHSSFVQTVCEVLGATQMRAHELELELTEGQLISDVDNAVEVLQSLRSIGVSVAIDDFGTGYSSLSYLHRFPVQCLKIDRSFVKTLSDEQNVAEIAHSIIMLAHSLGLSVVAEGVETATQAEVLAGWGCQQLQGYYFSKPVTVEHMTELLKADRTRRARERAQADADRFDPRDILEVAASQGEAAAPASESASQPGSQPASQPAPEAAADPRQAAARSNVIPFSAG